MAAVDGADRKSAKNADAPMDQSREAHLAAWLLHSPKGTIPKVYRPLSDDPDLAEVHPLTHSPVGKHTNRFRTLAP
jgi:hypothetical protein